MNEQEMNEIRLKVQVQTAKAKAAIKKPKFLVPLDTNTDDPRKLFELVQNPAHWKEPTIPAFVGTYTEARRLLDAIVHFQGGAEMVKQANGFFKVTGKGYYHYIGA